MNRFACWMGLLLVAACACGCATDANPRSFFQATAPGWVTVELRDGVTYDHAWSTALGILVKQFDIEFLSKDDGYIRTAWTYVWSKSNQENYRVRVTLKFADDRKSVDIKSEAQSLIVGGVWQWGVDSRQLSTLKTDLMGTIGRTAR